ncbi:uncharacterized protein GIQ15_02022 [Arthroderma uncinatum]|uniref:uncharacterized protein n=1 Tax=Arthroderma uncinatum TaxID=74035 RepID=UPI00144ACFBE|nr:uncharacterized protein GIQ15_02022 [Arthroderma uncinatum]KAF3482698.1 hypothetical protein GIQ15_02022 [Arthroderma uncinatum]
MLTAFTARPLVEFRPRDKSKIESILTYGDRLLVGLNTGSLRIYRVNEANGDEGETRAGDHTEAQDGAVQPATTPKPTDLLRELEKFSRYKIEQLAIIKEANILLSLSNGHVSIHDLQSYELHEQLTRTKGATTFAVTSNIEKDQDTGVPSIVSRLAVAVKRKLMLWTWQDMELEDDATEITLVSGIKTITWANGTKLLAGLSSSYVIVDVVTKEVTDIVGPGSIGGAGGQDIGRLGGVGASMSYIGMGGAAPKPLATRLCEGQILLAKDVNTHFVDTDGNALRRRQIPWTVTPEAVGYSYPYLLALQDPSKGILEVRNPETLSLLQSVSLPSATMMHIPQPNISLAHAGKGFLVGSGRVIWRMSALGYDSQIDCLVEQDHLDEAISLLGMLEDALLNDKEGRLREIKLRKAQTLFNKQKYRKSLDLFTEVTAPPEIVIRLFPKLIAGDLSSIEEEDNTSQVNSEESEENSTRPANGTSINSADPPTPDDKPKVKNGTYAPSVTSFLRGKTDDASETGSMRGKPADMKEPDKRLEGKDLKAAVYELQGFLADIRRRLSRFISPDGTLKPPSITVDQSDESTQSMLKTLGITSDDMESVDMGQKLRETATLVDTTLFRALMFATPTLAGSLFRIDNFCDPEVVMEKLEQTARYGDLIDFLFGKRLHRSALEQLKKFGQRENEEETSPELHGPKRTVAYLQNLPPDMIDLILEFAEWPLRSDPKLGMEIFLADTENAETLPRERVLEFLNKIDSKLAIRYSEHVIDELNDMTPDIHQRLLIMYLEQLLQSKKSNDVFANEDEMGACKRKLLKMLETSEQYSPARMLDRLPRDDPEFFEPRAVTLSKMGQHKQVLEIYVFKLNNPAKAEEYCNRTHLQDDTYTKQRAVPYGSSPAIEDEESRPSIYHTLLSLYLSPPHGYEPRYGPAIEILARHGSRLPASSTLDLIPGTLPIHDLEFYFRGRIRAANSILNQGRIISSLQRIQNMETEASLRLGDEVGGGNNRGRNRCITVSEDRVCSHCHKRLGGSVISVFPK